MSWKTWKKTLFSNIYCGVVRRAKSSKNAVFFSIFCNLCTKCLEKREKNNVFSHFLWDVVQKAQKTLFFALIRKFVQSVSKNVKKTLLSHTFCGTSCKKLIKHCFHIFCELCTKCLEKREKILLSHTFCGKSCKKLKKKKFFAFFANFVQNVSKNVKKTLFSPLFVGRRAKISRTLFFAFFANFVKSVSKKHCFLTLFEGRRAKCSKNAVYSHFLWTLHKVPRKTWKNTVFSLFLCYVVQKYQKTLFFAVFANFV